MPVSTFIDELLTEHENIAKILTLIEAELNELGNHNRGNHGLLSDAVKYMTDYPDLVHHPKEEVMFYWLQVKAPYLQAVIIKLGQEHNELANQGAKLQRIIKVLPDHDPVGSDELTLQGHLYTAMHREHMHLEETHVFPFAEQRLMHSDWRKIDGWCSKRCDPLFGDPVDKRYRRLRSHVDR